MSFLLIIVFVMVPFFVEAATVTLDLSTQFQTIKGWVAVAEIGKEPPAFQQQQMMDRAANELGITALRLDMPPNGNNATVGRSWCFRIDHTDPRRVNWASFDTLPGVRYNTAGTDVVMNDMVVPFKKLVEARGEPFTLYENPSFFKGGSTGIYPVWIQYNTGEYAEYLVSFAEYLAHHFGTPPTFMTIVNEASNNNNMTPPFEARVIGAVGPMLQAAGLKTKVQLAECVNATYTVNYIKEPTLTKDVLQYVGTVSWHDYGTQSSAAKAQVYEFARAHGLDTAQEETQLATYQTIYDDLVGGGCSYWGQYGLGGTAIGAGIQYYNTCYDGASLSVPSQYWNWRQVIHYVRPGFVRIGSTSDDPGVKPMAFKRNGTVVVTLGSTVAAAAPVTVRGLPAGDYGVSYSIPGGIAEQGIQHVRTGSLDVTVPPNSVLTIYSLTGADRSPELFKYLANPPFLKLGSGTSTALSAAATSPGLESLSYSWSVAKQPEGANVSLTSPNSANTGANGLSVPGLYIFSVAVSDGSKIVTRQVGFNVLSGNQPPVIDVVHSRSPMGQGLPILLTQPINSTLLLDQVSYDFEKDLLTFNWSIISQPSGAAAILDTPNSFKCLANHLDQPGDYVFKLTVSDGHTPVTQYLTVTVDPANPNAPVIRNASGSVVSPGVGRLQAATSDPDGDWIANWWDVTAKPEGAIVTLDDPGSPNTDFHVDTPGRYTFQLTTVDRTRYTQSDPITIDISSIR